MNTLYVRWLGAGALYAAAVGVWLVAIGVAPDVGFERMVSSIFRSTTEHAGGASVVARNATAVSGALTLFVAVIAWTLRPALLVPAARALVGRALAQSLVAWFLVDSIASVLIGAPFNALWNATLLIALLPPAVAAWRSSGPALTPACEEPRA